MAGRMYNILEEKKNDNEAANHARAKKVTNGKKYNNDK